MSLAQFIQYLKNPDVAVDNIKGSIEAKNTEDLLNSAEQMSELTGSNVDDEIARQKQIMETVQGLANVGGMTKAVKMFGAPKGKEINRVASAIPANDSYEQTIRYIKQLVNAYKNKVADVPLGPSAGPPQGVPSGKVEGQYVFRNSYNAGGKDIPFHVPYTVRSKTIEDADKAAGYYRGLMAVDDKMPTIVRTEIPAKDFGDLQYASIKSPEFGPKQLHFSERQFNYPVGFQGQGTWEDADLGSFIQRIKKYGTSK